VPGGRPVGQAVLHNQTHGQVNNPAGIVAAGIRKVAEIGIEIAFAFRTAVLGIADPKIDGTVGGQVSEIMQLSSKDFVPIGRVATMGARTLFIGA